MAKKTKNKQPTKNKHLACPSYLGLVLSDVARSQEASPRQCSITCFISIELLKIQGSSRASILKGKHRPGPGRSLRSGWCGWVPFKGLVLPLGPAGPRSTLSFRSARGVARVRSAVLQPESLSRIPSGVRARGLRYKKRRLSWRLLPVSSLTCVSVLRRDPSIAAFLISHEDC